MPLANGGTGIGIELTIQQARRFAEQTPDGRISARERRELQDPAELSAQGQRLSLQSEALGAVRESLASGDALLDTAESGFERVEQLLDELRTLSTRAARDDLSSAERAALNDRFQEALAALDRIANRTSFNGQNLLDAEVRRLVPLGTTQFDSVPTVGGGTGTFTLTPGLNGQGLRNIRFEDVTLTQGKTVTNNGFTFSDVREPSLLAAATPPSDPQPNLILGGVNIETENGTTTENFTLGGAAPALTATTTAGPGFRVSATTLTTVTLDGIVGTGSARLDLSEDFAITISGPAPTTSTTLALAGKPDTEFAVRAGTGNVPAEDEVNVSIGGVTPGALALRDVSLRGDREVIRATRLVDEAQQRLDAAEANVRGDGQRLSQADDNARTQRDGTIVARAEINDVPDGPDVSKQVADNIVNAVDLGIGLLGDGLRETVFERLF